MHLLDRLQNTLDVEQTCLLWRGLSPAERKIKMTHSSDQTIQAVIKIMTTKSTYRAGKDFSGEDAEKMEAGFYDLVLTYPGATLHPGARFLQDANGPLLLVKRGSEQFSKKLLCTTACTTLSALFLRISKNRGRCSFESWSVITAFLYLSMQLQWAEYVDTIKARVELAAFQSFVDLLADQDTKEKNQKRHSGKRSTKPHATPAKLEYNGSNRQTLPMVALTVLKATNQLETITDEDHELWHIVLKGTFLHWTPLTDVRRRRRAKTQPPPACRCVTSWTHTPMYWGETQLKECPKCRVCSIFSMS